ncbi:MAG: molybdopterin-dependent oxidoreductase [Chloroflexi bacterium]|nr:molybdopterin-dependent oxidoreductase [Chloroflexota bacterium]
MSIRKSLLPLFVALLVVTLGACGGNAPSIDWTVNVTGAVSNPLEISYHDLVGREQVTLEDVLMRRSQGEDSTNSWEGPAVGAILEEAGASASATAIVCMADDGYAMEIPLGELGDAIIALKRDGEWIGEEGGVIRIVVPSLPANSWISQLTDIQVVE